MNSIYTILKYSFTVPLEEFANLHVLLKNGYTVRKYQPSHYSIIAMRYEASTLRYTMPIVRPRGKIKENCGCDNCLHPVCFAFAPKNFMLISFRRTAFDDEDNCESRITDF